MGHAAAVVGVGVGCTIGIAATTAASADVVIIQMKLKQYRQRRKLDLWQGTAVEELHCSDGGILYWVIVVLCAKLWIVPYCDVGRHGPSH